MILSWIDGFRSVKAGRRAAGLPDEWLDDALRYAAARLTNLEDAEDAVMEAWHQATRKRADIMAAQDPRLYFIGMVRRCVNRRLRSRPTVELEESLPAPSPNSELKTDLGAALTALPDAQREAVVLKYVQGFTQEEIADLMERTPAAINSLLQRARAQLKSLLTEEEITQ